MNFWPLILVVVLVLINVPVSYALLISSVFYFSAFDTGLDVALIFQRLIAQCQSFALLAVPFFVTAGVIMEYAGIGRRLMDFVGLFTGRTRGGLAHANILLSTFMGGCSGSANADAAMEAKMLIPLMKESGIDVGFSAGVTATSACITPIIPPGIVLIIYATISGVSVGDMFLAGYLPGALMCIALMITVSIIARKRGYPPTRDKWPNFKEIVRITGSAVWALVVPLGILMGLRMGVFTPTEAGAVVVVYCLLVGLFIYRDLKPKMLPRLFLDSLRTTASVMFIVAGAAAFSYYLSWERIPQFISEMLLGVTTNKYVFLLIVNVFLLICGMFLECTAAQIMVIPLLVGAAQTLGINLVHFGILTSINIVIGGCTPPFGTYMFTVCAASGTSIPRYTKATWPLILTLIIVLFLVSYIPGISLLLPGQ
ncbi:MAG: TRAP transporter large permease [Clostridiales bacterium]|nr:TRAP transporter large permease [Clostridiales bacterium]